QGTLVIDRSMPIEQDDNLDRVCLEPTDDLPYGDAEGRLLKVEALHWKTGKVHSDKPLVALEAERTKLLRAVPRQHYGLRAGEESRQHYAADAVRRLHGQVVRMEGVGAHRQVWTVPFQGPDRHEHDGASRQCAQNLGRPHPLVLDDARHPP